MSLVEWLATREDRCIHGWHVPTQGCRDCSPSERAAVDAAIRQLAATGRPFSANDARSLHGVKGGVVGKAFREAKDAGLIRPYTDGDPLERSTARSTNGHHVFRWVAA